jgi:hypothetical protein
VCTARHGLRSVCGAWLAQLLVACTALGEHSVVRVSIAADAPVRAAVEEVAVRLEMQASDGGWIEKVARRFDDTASGWPLTLALGGNRIDSYGTYQLTATARDASSAVVAEARAIREFRSGTELTLAVRFEASCMFRPACGSGRTCHERECVEARSVFENAEPAADGGKAGSSGDEPAPGAGLDLPCSQAGLLSCAGTASRLPLSCDGSIWRAGTACAENERCDSEGPQRGTCQPVNDECVGREPDALFCKDEQMLRCRELIALEVRPCGQHEHCVTKPSGARCECLTGYRDDGAGCNPIADCSGCDPLTRCSMEQGARVCGACPDGYTGNGELGCVPLLTTLAPEGGGLMPELERTRFDYRLRVPLVTQRASIALQAPANSRIEVNGAPLPAAGRWTSGKLSLGQTPVQIAVIGESGATSTYKLMIERAGGEEAFIKAHVPGSEDTLGLSIGLSANTLVVGAPWEDSAATTVNGDAENDSKTDSGAAYVYERSGETWALAAYLKANDAAREDYLGVSVALSGDTIAVGAIRDNLINLADTPTRSGAVYVFVRKQGAWVQQARLDPSSGNAGDVFGYSVALAGDTLLVGSARDGSGGAAYVFARNGETWSEVQKLRPSKANAGAMFGSYVALSGDTLAVGAQSDDSAAFNGGAAYVFVKRGKSWVEQQQVVADALQPSAAFGYALSLQGDRLLVGAPRLVSLLSFAATLPSGEAFVFERSGEHWTQTQQLTATVPRASDYFGASVALTATGLIAVGAAGDSSGAAGVAADAQRSDLRASGAIYLFDHDGSAWQRSAFIKAAKPREGALFGFAAALTEEALAVGACFDSGNARGVNGAVGANDLTDSGAAYVFR